VDLVQQCGVTLHLAGLSVSYLVTVKHFIATDFLWGLLRYHCKTTKKTLKC